MEQQRRGPVKLKAPAPVEHIQTEREARLPLRFRAKAQQRFVYVHYPDRWDWSDVHGFLPSMRRVAGLRGANGVTQDGRPGAAVRGHTDKGAIPIDPEDRRLGAPWTPDNDGWGQYCRGFKGETLRDTDQPWIHYTDAWAVPTVMPGGRVRWDSEGGGALFAEFRSAVRDSDIIPPISDISYQDIRDRMIRSHERLGRRAGNNPHLVPQLEASSARLDALAAAWRKIEDGEDYDPAPPAREPKPSPTVGTSVLKR